MPKAPKIAIENFHGTNGSQTKLPTAGRMFATPQSPIIAAKEADEMSAELTDRGIIGIERVLRCQDESHAGRH